MQPSPRSSSKATTSSTWPARRSSGSDRIAEVAGEALGREPVFEPGDADAPGDVVADTTRFNELFDLPDRVGMAEGIRRMVSASR